MTCTFESLTHLRDHPVRNCDAVSSAFADDFGAVASSASGEIAADVDDCVAECRSSQSVVCLLLAVGGVLFLFAYFLADCVPRSSRGGLSIACCWLG
jgi:hypothetical protein